MNEVEKKFREIAKVQEMLLNITNSNIDDVTDAIYQSTLSQSPLILMKSIIKASVVRPRNLAALCQLYDNISALASNKNGFGQLKDLILNKLFLNCEKFVFTALQKGYFTQEEIVQKIHSLFYDDPDDLPKFISLFAWFCPEIDEDDNQLLLEFEDKLPSLRSDQSIPFHLKQFLNGYNNYKFNKWNLLKLRRTNCYEPNSLPFIILNDDVDTLNSIFYNDAGFDVNQIIQHSIYNPAVYPFVDSSLVQFAALTGSERCFQYLMNSGADITVSNKYNVTLAQFAYAGANKSIIEIIERKNLNLSNVLQAAIKYHQNDLFIEQLKKDVHVLKDFNKPFDSVLNCCVTDYNFPLLLLCLSKGCDINATGKYGMTMLNCAIQYWPSELILDLINMPNIDLLKKDEEGTTPLHLAAQLDEADVVKALLEKHQGEYQETDAMGRTPLHSSVAHNNVESTQVIIDSKRINPNATDRYGDSACHLGSQYDSAEALEVLLKDKGTNPQIENRFGYSPIDIATRHGNQELINLFHVDESSDPDDDYSEEEEEELEVKQNEEDEGKDERNHVEEEEEHEPPPAETEEERRKRLKYEVETYSQSDMMHVPFDRPHPQKQENVILSTKDEAFREICDIIVHQKEPEKHHTCNGCHHEHEEIHEMTRQEKIDLLSAIDGMDVEYNEKSEMEYVPNKRQTKQTKKPLFMMSADRQISPNKPMKAKLQNDTE